ncbi:MAG TPA: response regulator [Puia sp.]|jgi:CheY-like chemotaxis protein
MPPKAYILLAEDDNEDQDLLKEELLQLDPSVSVESVWNGQEALDFLNACSAGSLPCLLLLDYKMPMLNASEVLERLKGDPRYASMPKLVWSTSNQPEYIDICRERGAADYLVKPNSHSELSKLARRVLSFCAHG